MITVSAWKRILENLTLQHYTLSSPGQILGTRVVSTTHLMLELLDLSIRSDHRLWAWPSFGREGSASGGQLRRCGGREDYGVTTLKVGGQTQGGDSGCTERNQLHLQYSILCWMGQNCWDLAWDPQTKGLLLCYIWFSWYFSPWELEGITSPCCLLIGQYPHHMTLYPSVAIVSRFKGIHL